MCLRSFTFSVVVISMMINHDVNNHVHADELIIDDRSSVGPVSRLGTQWRLVTDDVMGGLSRGTLTIDEYKGKNCLRMRGDVNTENNGGFVQIALPLSQKGSFDASAYAGIEIEVAGNDETYNIHFRTASLWFPWQSYRYSFIASPDWQTYRIPFAGLTKYRTFQDFSKDEIIRIGLVAIGRDFKADVCLATIKFYSN
jgi:hypothetical protein